MNDIEHEIILALADCNMNESKAGRKIYMHRNTLTYHMRKIRRETGLDPKKFYDLAKLVDMVHEMEDITWQVTHS